MPTVLCVTCCGRPPVRDILNETPKCTCCGGISCLCAGKHMNWCEALTCCDWGYGHLNAQRMPNPSQGKVGVYEHRRILNQNHPGALQILHDLPKAPYEVGCSILALTCCMACPRIDCHRLCCGRLMEAEKSRQESDYTWIMENRLEVNRGSIVPLPPKSCGHCILQNCGCAYCCTDLGISDSNKVTYFHDEMFNNISVKKGCGLKWYNCLKWCFGGHGEPIKLKTRPCPFICPCWSAKCCGKTAFTVHVPNGYSQQWADAIAGARDDARRRAGASGSSGYHDVVKVGAAVQPVTGVGKMERD